MIQVTLKVRRDISSRRFTCCRIELNVAAEAGAILIWLPILSTASTTTLASTAMLHSEPHEDFRRFCQVVATAVVDSWSEEEKSKGCVSRRTPSLWPSEFVRCQTDFERVNVLMRIPSVRQFTLLPANQSSVCQSNLKSDNKSDELRELGNYAWQRHQIPQALSFYTKAVLNAASPEKRALAFANRSCVLVRVGANQAVLDDITHALENDYPTQKRPQLYVRRAQTLLLMGRVVEARSAFHEARDSIQDGSNSSTLDLLITNGLQRCAALALARPTGGPITSRDTQNAVPYVSYPNPPTHLLNRINFGQEQRPKRVSTTGKADRQSVRFDPSYKIHYGDDNVGWQLIANRDFFPGELVLIERPFVRRLNFSSIENDCYNCLQRSYNLYPCRGCSEVGFCSRACEQAVWTKSTDSSNRKRDVVCHRFECGQLARFPNGNFNRWKWLHDDVVENSSGLARYQALFHQNSPMTERIVGPQLCWLAFASIAQTPPQAIRSLAQGFSLKPGKDQVNSAVPRRSLSTLSAFSGIHEPPLPDLCDAGLLSVGWLRTLSEKRDALNLWQNTIAAVFLTHCLKAGGYKLDWDDNCLLYPNGDILLVDEQPLPASWAAACLLHQLQCFPIASQDITRVVCMNDASDPSENPGMFWQRLRPNKFAKGVYPIMSLRPQSCDMNTYAVYMADGVCALFTLKRIKRGETLSRSRVGHFFYHNRTERQDDSRQSYLVECQCVPCRENWSSHDLTVRIRCPSCRKITSPNTLGLHNLHSGRTCSCPRKHLRRILERYGTLCDNAKNLVSTIPSEYRDIPFHTIPQELMDEQLGNLTRMLRSVGLDGLLVRPSYILLGLQARLMQLLSLRYGCCVTETGEHNNDSELSSYMYIVQFRLHLENDR
ncbi:SET and MYND domain-containing protein 4 [Paragonimus skrjabini miyazakii]|uniref:SET and MYND domain-containing protein 4 n=1 Tax=Paragonimus skrjabini miyazakii TaxID=59628 RepID=A0A8S9Z8D5_9TREM|nr:SET and MYND domain-containing protein 4 [Paragonimus skrjabini miyazakii]